MASQSEHRLVADLLDRYAPKLKKAFLDAIDELKSKVVLRVVVERLEKGDVNGAIEALHLEREAFNDFDLMLLEAYNAGGTALVQNLPRITDPLGNQVVVRFGVRNLPAEAWLSTHSSSLIGSVLDDQREAIRRVLTEGLATGQNPRATALNIIGRLNRITNLREGGIIGLTSAQEQFVAAARLELLSGDATLMRHYLSRERRDKRFDRSVLKGIATGKPLDAASVAKAVGRYADRLLLLRGEIIARTETLTSMAKARDDAIRQMVADGNIAADQVTKVWHSAGDTRVRDTHKALNGQKVGLDGRFLSPSGALLSFPGDPSAPPSETIACRCWMEYDIDYFAPLVARIRGTA